jgi:hypothetical protein
VSLQKSPIQSQESNRLYFHDPGSANENMFLERFNQGLIMHAMDGFNIILVKDVFGIPDDYEVGIIVARGYQGTNDILKNSKLKIQNIEKENLYLK